MAVKVSLTGLGVFATASLRFAIAAGVLALWARISGRQFTVPRGRRRALFVISLVFTVQLSLFYLGLSRTLASRAILMVNMQPFFLLILAHRFIPGERITPRKFAGIVLGFAGVACIVAPQMGLGGVFTSGEPIVMAAAMIWAANSILIKRALQDISPFQVVFYPMLVAVPLSVVCSALFDAPAPGPVSGPVLAGLAYQSLVTASFGFVAWSSLLQRYGAVNLHVFIFIMPISGVLLGGIMLAEPLTFNLLAALAFIVAGILCINLRQRPPVPEIRFSRNI